MTYQIDGKQKFMCLVCGDQNAGITGYGFSGTGTVVDTKCPNCNSIGKITNMQPWYGREMKKTEALSIFELAGLKAIREPIEIMNKYHGGGSGEKQHWHPWWLIKTEYGYIEIGWRKNVISINWEDTDIRGIVTTDNVTKDQSYVHAWSVADAVKYMTEFNKIACVNKK